MRARDTAVEVRWQWSPDDDQDLGIAIEHAVTHPQPLAATLAALRAAVPSRSLEDIAERWLLAGSP